MKMVLRLVVLLTLLALVASSYKVKVVDSQTDMPTSMQQEAVTVTLQAFDKFGDDADKAKYIVREFTERHGDTMPWRCFIGQFAASNAHLSGSEIVMVVQEEGFWSFGRPVMVALFK